MEKSTAQDIEAKPSGKQKAIKKSSPFTRLRLIDFATFSYLSLVAVLIILFNSRVEYWYVYVVIHFTLIGFLLAFFQFADNTSSKVVSFFRDTYPFFLYIFLFKEVSLIVNIFFPFWLEPYLIKWDFVILGNHPTVWLQRFHRPWLTELMAFSYWSYYLLLPLGGIILYVQKNRAMFHSLILNLSLTLYICYFSYLFLTARGPQQTLAFLHVDREAAGFFDGIVMTIQDQAAISGAAFPSSHVAAVWIVLVYMFRFKKWLGWALLPLILSLTFSTVYLQYHYAVDAFAGVMLMCLTYPLGLFFEQKFCERLAHGASIAD